MVINHVRKKEETGGDFASAAQKKKDRKIPRNWQAFINVLSTRLMNLLLDNPHHAGHADFNIFTVLFHLIIYSNGFLVASICVSS